MIVLQRSSGLILVALALASLAGCEALPDPAAPATLHENAGSFVRDFIRAVVAATLL